MTLASKKKFEAKQKDLADEETAANTKFDKEFKGNKAKAIAEEAKLAAEKKENDKVEAADKARIESVYDEKQKAQDKVEAAEKKEDDDNTAAEKSRHSAASKVISDKLNKDEEQNSKDDAIAASKKKKAEQADEEYKAALVKDKKIAEEQKKAEDAEDHTDEEMKGCKEYTQCEVDSADGATSKCFDVKNVPAGYEAAKDAKHYMAKDLIGCTTDESEAADMGEDAHEGEAWTGLPAPPAPAPKPTPSATCVKKMDAVKKMYKGAAADVDSKNGCPYVAVACHTKDRTEAKAALLALYDAAESCPAWCQPGSKEADKYGNGAAEICITAADISMMKAQIEDMPMYKASGTGNRFKAGPEANVCRMTKNFMKGWKSAAGELELVEADPTTIAHAEAEKKANSKTEAAASKEEAEWTKKEKKLSAESDKLKAKDVALKNKAAKDNAEAAKKMSDDADDAASKVMAANKATAKAEKANAKAQKGYKAEQKKLKGEGKKAAKATKARMATYESEMAANKKATKAGKAAATKAAKDEKDNAAANKKELARVADVFHKETKSLAKKFKKHEKKFANEKKKFDKKFDKEDKKNASKAKKAMLKISKEKVMNGIKAAAEQAKINTDAAKIAAAHAKKNKLWHEAEALKAKALATDRAGKKKRTMAKAAKKEGEYKAAKKIADAMQKKADEAHQKEKDYAKKMAKDQADQDKASDEEDHKDEEMKGCKSDGSECELDSADGSTTQCFPVKNPPAGVECDAACKGAKYYIAKDLVTCTTKKASASVDKGYSGSDWTGLTNSPTAAPVGPDAKCLALRKAFYAKGAVGADHKTAESIACAKDLDAKESKAGLEAFWNMGAACPTTCDKGTDVHAKEVNGDDTSNSICVTREDIGMMRMQIEDMPNYKKSGTNGRFSAGPPPAVCRMVKNIQAGWASGKKLQ